MLNNEEKNNYVKQTKIINFIAGAGAGKSTMCSGVFSKLKMKGIDCELSSEYAKELVWESRNETFKDEVYIFAKQNHRLFRLNGKVDVVITDRPLIMSNIYNQYYNPDRKEFNKTFEDFVKANWNMYDNVNIFINRVKKYNPNGRNETLEQAKELDTLFKNYLDTNKIDYICVDGNEKGLDDAVNYIINILDNTKKIKNIQNSVEKIQEIEKCIELLEPLIKKYSLYSNFDISQDNESIKKELLKYYEEDKGIFLGIVADLHNADNLKNIENKDKALLEYIQKFFNKIERPKDTIYDLKETFEKYDKLTYDTLLEKYNYYTHNCKLGQDELKKAFENKTMDEKIRILQNKVAKFEPVETNLANKNTLKI